MALSFTQRRKIHEAHEARHAFSARESLSCNTNIAKLLEFTCTDDYELFYYEKDETQGVAPDTPARTQDSDKRVHWAESGSPEREWASWSLGRDGETSHGCGMVCYVLHLAGTGESYGTLEGSEEGEVMDDCGNQCKTLCLTFVRYVYGMNVLVQDN